MRRAKAYLFVVLFALLALPVTITQTTAQTEAPTGYDNLTNGFVSQAQFDLDRANFEEREQISDGLGPLYNAQACAECHQNPVTGAISQITELRAGHFDGFNFINHPGGSLINDRAINANIQERVLGGNEVGPSEHPSTRSAMGSSSRSTATPWWRLPTGSPPACKASS